MLNDTIQVNIFTIPNVQIIHFHLYQIEASVSDSHYSPEFVPLDTFEKILRSENSLISIRICQILTNSIQKQLWLFFLGEPKSFENETPIKPFQSGSFSFDTLFPPPVSNTLFATATPAPTQSTYKISPEYTQSLEYDMFIQALEDAIFFRLADYGGIPFGRSCLLPSNRDHFEWLYCNLNIYLSASTIIIQASLNPANIKSADDHSKDIILAPFCIRATSKKDSIPRIQDCSNFYQILGLPMNTNMMDRMITVILDDSNLLEYPLGLCFTRKEIKMDDDQFASVIRGIVDESQNDFWSWKNPICEVFEKLKQDMKTSTSSVATTTITSRNVKSPKDTPKRLKAQKQLKSDIQPKIELDSNEEKIQDVIVVNLDKNDSNDNNNQSSIIKSEVLPIISSSTNFPNSTSDSNFDLDSMLIMDSTSPGMLDFGSSSHDDNPTKQINPSMSRQISSSAGGGAWDIFDLDDNQEVTEDDFSFFDDVPKPSKPSVMSMNAIDTTVPDLTMDTSLDELDGLSFGLETSTDITTEMNTTNEPQKPLLPTTNALNTLNGPTMTAAEIADVLDVFKTPGRNSTQSEDQTPGYLGSTPVALPKTPYDDVVNDVTNIADLEDVELITNTDQVIRDPLFIIREKEVEGIPKTFSALAFSQALLCSDEKYASGKFVCDVPVNNGRGESSPSSFETENASTRATSIATSSSCNRVNLESAVMYSATWKPSLQITQMLIGRKRKFDQYVSDMNVASIANVVKSFYSSSKEDISDMQSQRGETLINGIRSSASCSDDEDESDGNSDEWSLASSFDVNSSQMIPITTFASLNGNLWKSKDEGILFSSFYLAVDHSNLDNGWKGGELQQKDASSGLWDYINRGPTSWHQDHSILERKLIIDVFVSQVVDAPYPYGLSNWHRSYSSLQESRTTVLAAQRVHVTEKFCSAIHNVILSILPSITSGTSGSFNPVQNSSTVRGPMTLGSLLELHQLVNPPQSKYGKYQVRKKRSTSLALRMLNPPALTVRRFHHNRDDYYEMLPTSCRFWEKLGLDPLSGPKDIEAFTIFPKTLSCQPFELQSQISDWLQQVKVIYELCGLGTHNTGTLSEYKMGMVLVNLLPPVQNESELIQKLNSYESMCVKLGTLLASRPANFNAHTVIYILNPFTHETSIYDMSRCFARLKQSYELALAKSKTVNSTLLVNKLVLQIVPLSHVIDSTASALPQAIAMRSLAFSVYTRCRAKNERKLMSIIDKNENELDFAPAIAISRPPPNRINFALRTPPPPPPLLDQNLILHVGYRISLDEKYLCIVWMDERGRDIFRCEAVSLYLAGRRRLLRDVIEEVWDLTKSVMARAIPEWDVIVTKLGQFEVEEVQAWMSVISSGVVAPSPQVSQMTPIPTPTQNACLSRLSLVCIDFEMPLAVFQPVIRPNTTVSTNSSSFLSTGDSFTNNSTEKTEPKLTSNILLDGSMDIVVDDKTNMTWGMVFGHRMILSPGRQTRWIKDEEVNGPIKRLLSAASGALIGDFRSPHEDARAYYVHLVHVYVQGEQNTQRNSSTTSMSLAQSITSAHVNTPVPISGPATGGGTPGGINLHSPANSSSPSILLRDILNQMHCLMALGDAYYCMGSGECLDVDEIQTNLMRLPIHLELCERMNRHLSFVVPV